MRCAGEPHQFSKGVQLCRQATVVDHDAFGRVRRARRVEEQSLVTGADSGSVPVLRVRGGRGRPGVVVALDPRDRVPSGFGPRPLQLRGPRTRGEDRRDVRVQADAHELLGLSRRAGTGCAAGHGTRARVQAPEQAGDERGPGFEQHQYAFALRTECLEHPAQPARSGVHLSSGEGHGDGGSWAGRPVEAGEDERSGVRVLLRPGAYDINEASGRVAAGCRVTGVHGGLLFGGVWFRALRTAGNAPVGP